MSTRLSSWQMSRGLSERLKRWRLTGGLLIDRPTSYLWPNAEMQPSFGPPKATSASGSSSGQSWQRRSVLGARVLRECILVARNLSTQRALYCYLQVVRVNDSPGGFHAQARLGRISGIGNKNGSKMGQPLAILSEVIRGVLHRFAAAAAAAATTTVAVLDPGRLSHCKRASVF
ncbi:hypothetical protein P280DRAFT_90353 [Massarina eburnea CBS 473.64]|uniref:Uncharacterized protein n=1 Tax=Massarina eburnea CBS 473.64 TaxID=1395130 RepID=A0A6A6RTP9_9PLEO|nr:hypothetical protein P280DRAFT_90353 [Massarina eburnea CBS 473.64]